MVSAHRGKELPKPIVLFLLLVVMLALASWLDALVGYLRLGRPGLNYLWMYYPGFDFVDYTLQFPYLHTPRFFTLSAFPWVYPAPAIFVLYPFYRVVDLTSRTTGFVVFALTVVVADAAVALRFRRALLQRGLSGRAAFAVVGTLAFFGWPLYFALQRGNIESLLWIGTALGIACMVQQRYVSAAILLGAVGSVKWYPLLFLTLLLKPRRFREVVLGIVVASVISVLALRFLSPNVGFAWQQVRLGIHRWSLLTTSSYLVSGVGSDHSAFGLMKQCTLGSILRYPHALQWYLYVAGFLCSAVFLLRVLFLPMPNQLLFVACATVLLPPTSYDYTLVNMLIPCGLLILVCIEQARAGQQLRPFVPAFCLIAVVLAPLSFVHSHSGPEFNPQGAVRAVALLLLSAIAAVVRLPQLSVGQQGPCDLTRGGRV